MIRVKRRAMIRHTKSVANENPTMLQTQSDATVGLAEIGHVQAAETGKHLFAYAFALQDVTRLHFIVSPYPRAMQTANDIINQNTAYDFSISYTIDPLLHEKGLGQFEGYTPEEIATLFGATGEAFANDFKDPDKRYAARPAARVKNAVGLNGEVSDHDHHGESYQDCDERAAQFLHNAEFCDEPGVLNVIVGHGRFNTFVKKQLLQIEEADYFTIPVCHNGAIELFAQNTQTGLWLSEGVIFDGFSSGERDMNKPVVTPQ